MSPTLRLASCAALVGLGLVGVYVLFPAVMAPLNSGLSGGPESLHDYFEERQRGQTLRQRLRAARARLRVQDQICQDLIDGRLTLAEAARRFNELPDEPDNYRQLLRLYYKGTTDEERFMWMVIHWAGEMLQEEPERARGSRQRWEVEIQNWAEESRRRGPAKPPRLRATAH
jgi:hypothetical protein